MKTKLKTFKQCETLADLRSRIKGGVLSFGNNLNVRDKFLKMGLLSNEANSRFEEVEVVTARKYGKKVKTMFIARDLYDFEIESESADTAFDLVDGEFSYIESPTFWATAKILINDFEYQIEPCLQFDCANRWSFYHQDRLDIDEVMCEILKACALKNVQVDEKKLKDTLEQIENESEPSTEISSAQKVEYIYENIHDDETDKETKHFKKLVSRVKKIVPKWKNEHVKATLLVFYALDSQYSGEWEIYYQIRFGLSKAQTVKLAGLLF